MKSTKEKVKNSGGKAPTPAAGKNIAKSAKTAPSKKVVDEFDLIVNQALKDISKGVVVPPSDPNAGAAVPIKQSSQPSRKKASGTQMDAVFDRNAGESNRQLDQWMKDTNDLTESPDKFVEDDSQKSIEDPDRIQSRQSDSENPLSNDEDVDVNPGEGEPGDEELETLDEPEVYKSRTGKNVKKSHTEDDDDLDEDEDDDEELEKSDGAEEDEHDDKPTEENDGEVHVNDGEEHIEKSRKSRVRKALGRDAMEVVDAFPVVKALVDAVIEWHDDAVSEVRALRSEFRREMADVRKSTNADLKKVTKSLASGLARVSQQPAREAIVDDTQVPDNTGGAPVRKSVTAYGAPAQTNTKYQPSGFNLAKALDVIEEAFQKNTDGISQRDLIILENDKAPINLSNAAKTLLLKNKLI